MNNSVSGVYRGYVECIEDPLNMCRVQVRVPMFHGTEKDLPSKDLPWAYPSFMGAGYMKGSFIIPEVGDLVWILFEGGDNTKPVYIGNVVSGPARQDRVYKGPSNTYDGGTYTRPSRTPDTPFYLIANLAKKIVYRSPKRASIEVDETDGNESVSITDRLGNVFGLKSSASSSSGNKISRGNANGTTGVRTESYIKSKIGFIYKSIRNALFRVVSTTDRESVDISVGDVKIHVNQKDGDSKVLITYTAYDSTRPDGYKDRKSQIEVNSSGIYIKSEDVVNVNADGINMSCYSDRYSVVLKTRELPPHIEYNHPPITEGGEEDNDITL